MARITHFHISGDNPEQLVLFYEKTFQFVGNAQKLTQGNGCFFVDRSTELK